MTRFAPHIHGLAQCSDPPTIAEYEAGYTYCHTVAMGYRGTERTRWLNLADGYIGVAIKIAKLKNIQKTFPGRK